MAIEITNRSVDPKVAKVTHQFDKLKYSKF